MFVIFSLIFSFYPSRLIKFNLSLFCTILFNTGYLQVAANKLSSFIQLVFFISYLAEQQIIYPIYCYSYPSTISLKLVKYKGPSHLQYTCPKVTQKRDKQKTDATKFFSIQLTSLEIYQRPKCDRISHKY